MRKCRLVKLFIYIYQFLSSDNILGCGKVDHLTLQEVSLGQIEDTYELIFRTPKLKIYNSSRWFQLDLLIILLRYRMVMQTYL